MNVTKYDYKFVFFMKLSASMQDYDKFKRIYPSKSLCGEWWVVSKMGHDKIRVSYFVVCDSLSQKVVNDEEKTVIIDPISFMLVPFLPTERSFTVAFGIVSTERLDLKIELKMESPSGELITTIDREVESPEFKRFAIFEFGVEARNFIFQVEGEYKFYLSVDGVIIGTQSINVFIGDTNHE